MAIATTLDELKTQIDASVQQQALALSQRLLPAGDLLDFVLTLPELKLDLAQVQVTLQNDTLLLTGGLGGTWKVPLLSAASLSDVTLEVRFEQPTPHHPIVSSLKVTQATIGIAGSDIGFTGALGADRRVSLELVPSGGPSGGLSLAALARFASGGKVGSLVPDGIPVLDALTLQKATVDFGFAAAQESRFAFTLGLAGDWPIIDKNLFALKSASIDLAVTLSPTPDGGTRSQTATRLDAVSDIAGETLDVRLGFRGRDDWMFSVLPVEGGALPGLAELAGAVGGAALQADVQAGLKALEIDEIGIDGIAVRFDPYAKALKSLRLESHFTLLGGRIDLITTMPNFRLTGGLPVRKSTTPPGDASAIHLKQLAEHYFGASDNFPDIDVTELVFSAQPKSGDFTLSVLVEDDWSIPVGQSSIALRNAGFSIERAGGDTTGEIQATLAIGSIDFTVSASHPEADAGWIFEGTTGAGQKIDLTAFVGALLQLLGITLPSSVPEITLDNLDIRFDTKSREFDFKGETDVEIEVPFIVGDNKHIHAEVNLASTLDTATGKRDLTGFMEGELTIGSSLFTLQYTLAKDSHVFKASWESTSPTDLLGLDTLLTEFGVPNSVQIPKGLDLNLKKVYLEYTAERETIELVAESATYGTAFLIASKLPLGTADESAGAPPAPDSWSFVFGLEFVGATQLSKIPVVGSALGAADILTLREVGILVSSADFKDFTIPQLPPLATVPKGTALPTSVKGGADATKPIGVDTTLKLQKGIAFVGVADLSSSQQPAAIQALGGLVGQAELVVTLAYAATQKDFVIRGLLEGGVDIPTGGSSELKLANAGIELGFGAQLEFAVFGEMSLHFDSRVIDVIPRLVVTPESAIASLDIEIENGGWQAPVGLTGLTLDEVGFEVGVNFVPPGLDFGLQGASHIGDQAPKSDDFAFVMELIEEIPDPLLLSFYVEEIDVKTALELFAPDVDGSSLPGFVTEIKVTQLSFYWAEEQVTLPDGTIAQPGLAFSGNVEILSFAAHAALSIQPATGIQGDLELAPIHVAHIIDVTGHGKGVYINEVNGQPVRESVRPSNPAPAVQRVEVVPPGGAVLQFRTTQSPYLFVSLIVTLLDLEHEEVEGLVTDQGFIFKLLYQLTDIVKAELDVTLGKEEFHLYSQFALHLKADIGPIHIVGIDFGTLHLDAGFDLEMQIDATAEAFSLSVWGSFEFEGATLTLPKLTLSVAPASLTELPEKIIEHIGQEAEEIFKDLFDEAGKLIGEAAQEVAHLAEEAGEEIEKLGEEAVEEAGKIVDEAEQAVASGVKEVEKEAKAIEQEAAKILTDAGQEVEKIGKAAVAEVEKIGKAIAKVVDEAAHEIEAIGQEIAQEAQAVAEAVEQFAAEAVKEVAAIATAVEQEVAMILGDAEKVAQQVLAAARQAVAALEHEAEQIWNDVRNLAAAAARALENAGRAVANTAKKAWHAISKY